PPSGCGPPGPALTCRSVGSAPTGPGGCRPVRSTPAGASGCGSAPPGLCGQWIGVAVGHLPLAAFAAVDLGRAEGVTARGTVDGHGRALQADGECHVAEDVVRLELEPVRRAVREASLQQGEELVDLALPVRVAPRTADGDRLAPGPDGPPRPRIA